MPGMVVGGLRQRNPVTDPIQARWLVVTQMIRDLKKEQARLKEQMRTGVCSVCGSTFERTNAKKQYCSQQCNSRLYYRNHINVRFDADLIAEMLPALEKCGQLSDRNLDIVRMVVVNGQRAAECADHRGITRERVGQILGRATTLSRLIKKLQGVPSNGVSHV